MLSAITVLLAAGTMLVLAIAMGGLLGWANRVFHVEVNPKIEAINTALPGVNCGGCGYIGCNEYAEAVVNQGAPVNQCTVGGAGCAGTIADIMGVEIEQTWPQRAVVHCAATQSKRLQRGDYRGEPSCSAANLVAGVQGCVFGCLGFGDCVAACDYDAIRLRDGLATVDYDKCIGCGACARACPRNIISMVPFKSSRILVVACANKDFGKDVKEVCEVGCIGCKKCERASDHIRLVDNLPQIDYDQYDPNQHDMLPVIEDCPMEGLVHVGKPAAPGDATAAPDRVTADFKTTVDKTEWLG